MSGAAYHKWLHREIPENEHKNRRIADEIEKIHTESPDKGYRRIRDDLERYHGITVIDKRVLRICRKLHMKSTIKYSNHGCTRQAANPQYIAENILNREFTAAAPNEKTAYRCNRIPSLYWKCETKSLSKRRPGLI